MKNVVCVGLSKTGTTSLQSACNKLGIKTCHASDGKIFMEKALFSLRNNRKILSKCNPPGFFSNIFIPSNYKGVDKYYTTQEWRNFVIQRILKDYPETYFILTLRKLEDWINSRSQHVISNQRNEKYMDRDHGWNEIDVNLWVDEMFDHIHFVTRIIPPEKLLIMNICEGDGYKLLCGFLGEDDPIEPFPHANKSRKR